MINKTKQKCKNCQREYTLAQGSTLLVCHCKLSDNGDGTTTGVVTPVAR